MKPSCPICVLDGADVTGDSNRDLRYVNCRRCGKFGVTGQAEQTLRRDGDTRPTSWMLSAWVRNQTSPPTLTTQVLEELAGGLAEPSALEKTERFMMAVALKRAADTVDLDLNLDYPLLWASGAEEAIELLVHLRNQGYLRIVQTAAGTSLWPRPRVMLTAKGAVWLQRGETKASAVAVRLIRISEVTRRDILDGLQIVGVCLEGRLSEIGFLSRVFDLDSLPSTDPRFRTAREDIAQHRARNEDWPDQWPLSYEPFNLLKCEDEQFTRFLCELVHPVVRAQPKDVDDLVALLNSKLQRDGVELWASDSISGRPVYAARSITSSSHDSNAVQSVSAYDVFISYNSHDRTEVEQFRDKLGDRGLKAWLDIHEILPGDTWQDELAKALKLARAFAIMVGQSGFGPWHMKELQVALSAQAERKARVIPVLLPSAPQNLALPEFLTLFAWSDLRQGFSDQEMDRLVSGIKKSRGLPLDGESSPRAQE